MGRYASRSRGWILAASLAAALCGCPREGAPAPDAADASFDAREGDSDAARDSGDGAEPADAMADAGADDRSDAAPDGGPSVDAGVRCDAMTPCPAAPPAECSGSVVRTYESATCVAGECRYPTRDVHCPFGCAAAACAMTCAPTAGWSISTVDPTPEAGNDSEVATDALGSLHVIHWNLSERAARLAHRDPAGRWTSRAIPGGGPGDVVADGAGGAHYAYRLGETAGDGVFYAHRDGRGAWTEVGTRIGAGSNPSIAVDPSGNVHVVRVAPGFRGLLHGRRDAAGMWTDTSITTSMAAIGPDLAIGADGRLHVAYPASAGGTLSLAYATSATGTAWTTEIVDAAAGDGVHRGVTPTIAIDSAGTLHIAHTSFSAPSLFHSRRPVGGSWSTSVISTRMEEHYDASVAIDPGGGVHVVVRRGFDLVHARMTAPGVWADGYFAPNVAGTPTSFAFDPWGGAHVTYQFAVGPRLEHAYRRFCR